MVICLVLFCLQCAGPKKLTPDEFENLSPQERVTYLEEYVRKNKTDIESMKLLYKEYLALDMTEKAIPVMERIIDQDPYQTKVQFEYGELKIFRGENMEAYRAFRSVLNSPGGTAYASSISRYIGGKYSIRQITNSPADEAFPVFTPDGKSVVYQTNESGNWDIAEKNLSSGEVRIIIGTSSSEELPFISPDGKKMVYTSNTDDRRPIDDKFKVREIYLIDLNTGITKNLTESIADDWLPRFSHDGKYITFVSERRDLRSVPYTEKRSDIFRMESNGDFHTQLSIEESNEGGACFNITDDRIYFHSNRNGSYDIFIMKTDGTLPMTILSNQESNEVNPFVSPDSQHIVFFSDQSGSYDVYRAKIDGSEFERLTVSPAQNTNPAYSPDGKFITYHSDQNGNYDIFILNLTSISEPTAQELIRTLDGFLGL